MNHLELFADALDYMEHHHQAAEQQARARNRECITFEGHRIPLELYVGIVKAGNASVKYNDRFAKLHTAVCESK